MFGMGKHLLALAAAALCLALAGCGGGGDGTSTTASPPLTKDEFLKRANAICRAGVKKKEQQLISALKEDGKEVLEATPEEFESLAGNIVFPLYGEVISELEATTPPVPDQPTVEKFVSGYRATLEELEDEPSLVLEDRPYNQPNEEAGKYGLEACVL
jgi:hypothetical protein